MLPTFRLLTSYAGHPALRAASPAIIISLNNYYNHCNQSYVAKRQHYQMPNIPVKERKTMFTTTIAKDLHGSPLKRIITPSIFMSSTRLMLTPTICYMLINNMHDQALICFGIAALTDLVENVLPNRSISDKYMDAIIDKILTASCFITLYNLDIITIYFIKAWIFRDLCIVTGASIFRYFGFNESPTLKQFFSFNKYPTIGLEPIPLSRFHTFMQYLTICSLIGTSHLVGTDVQYWLMIVMGSLTTLSFSLTLGTYYYNARAIEHFISTEIAKWRS